MLEDVINPGYIKQIREDGKIDISLQPLGYDQSIDENTRKVLEYLKANDGVISLTDKSDPRDIMLAVQMSKKNFKKALGNLYRNKQVKLEKHQTTLC